MQKQDQGSQTPINLPPQIVESLIRIQDGRVNSPVSKNVLGGILAGVFIALGAAASNVAMHGISNVSVARLVGGSVFPIGLMMVILMGGRLFTGDCLLIMGMMDKRYKLQAMLRVLAVVYVCNLAGGILVAVLSYFCGQFNYSDGMLGAFTIHVALGKTALPFASELCSGILCNVFVCVAVLMAAAAKDGGGKIWASFFPIFAFVVSGYEHCVANMYYIPAGILAAQNEKYAQLAVEQYGHTAEQLAGLDWISFFTDNVLMVTLGNIIGGMVFVAIPMYFANRKKAV